MQNILQTDNLSYFFHVLSYNTYIFLKLCLWNIFHFFAINLFPRVLITTDKNSSTWNIFA